MHIQRLSTLKQLTILKVMQNIIDNDCIKELAIPTSLKEEILSTIYADSQMREKKINEEDIINTINADTHLRQIKANDENLIISRIRNKCQCHFAKIFKCCCKQ